MVAWLMAVPALSTAPSAPDRSVGALPALTLNPWPTALEDGFFPPALLIAREPEPQLDSRIVRERAIAVSRGAAQRRPPAAPAKPRAPQAAAPATPAPETLPVTLQWPITGSYISSRFGWRDGVIHEGIDLPQKAGHPILAAAAGTVELSAWDKGYGYSVIIDHGSGVRTRYAHASKLLVAKGEAVQAGQVIAQVGNTGHSYGNHLHFEVIVNGKAYNPLLYLPKRS